MQVFHHSGKIVDVLENGEILWLPDNLFIPWRSQIEDVEFLPSLYIKRRPKTGKCSVSELKELRLRFPELIEELKPKEQLHSQHLALGDWQIYRDIQKDFKDAPVRTPVLINPEIIIGLCGEDPEPEIRARSGLAVLGHFKRYGLLGVPIQSKGHWTLLTIRRSGGEHFEMHGKNFLQIKYYDSVEKFSNSCWEVATKVLNFIAPELDAYSAKINACRTPQSDAHSCGLFDFTIGRGRSASS